METAQTPIESTKRPVLREEKRNQYLLALNELVGELSINESRPVDLADFCERHQQKVSFFEALRGLDGLVKDFIKSDDQGGLLYFKATPTLFKITPKQIVVEQRAAATREHFAKKRELQSGLPIPEMKPVSPPAEEFASEPPLKSINETQQESTIGNNMKNFEAYTVRIESSKMDLRLDVQSRKEARIINAIMLELNY